MTKTTTPDFQRPANPPPAVVRLLQEASHALSLGRPESAEQSLDRVLELASDHVEAHRLMGIAALMTGKHAKAIDNLRSALAQRPGDATINMTLGSALIETGESEAGLTHLKRACELAPKTAGTWLNFGIGLKFAGHMEQARDAFKQVVAIDPGHIPARTKLAEVLVSLGDTPAAVSMLREILNRRPDDTNAWFILGSVKSEPLSSEDVRQLQNLVDRAGLPDHSRIPLMYTLAKALEDQSDYAAAFDMVDKANALKRRHLSWDRNDERVRVEAIAQAFSGPLPEPSDPTFGKEVIFVVCLPRSGSTLTEQILASHPRVQGGDELLVLPNILNEESDRRGQPFSQWVPNATRVDWRRLGEDYLERTREIRGQHPQFTDKGPSNWAYVGAALAMLPGAHIVNSRRDPLETCFSCYRQMFPIGAQFSYDLDDMADYYAGYDRLSALWRQKFPRRYFENQYESLQKDTEGQIRRLLDFCELPFDPACLAFHQTQRTVQTMSSAQVREPLRHNTARSTHYGAKLDPLRAKLHAAGVSAANT